MDINELNKTLDYTKYFLKNLEAQFEEESYSHAYSEHSFTLQEIEDELNKFAPEVPEELSQGFDFSDIVTEDSSTWEPQEEISPIVDFKQIDKRVVDVQKEEMNAEMVLLKPKKKVGLISVLSTAFFYCAIAVVLVAALTFGTKADGMGSSKTIGGYAYFTVLTASMQSEIPKGSFILVKQTDPNDIQVGDVITFMKNSTTSITHKVINIYEDHNGEGYRGFQTKGVNNPKPDAEIVDARNVVGVVQFHVDKLGAVLSYIRENIIVVFIFFVLLLILSFALKGLFSKDEKPKPKIKNKTLEIL